MENEMDRQHLGEEALEAVSGGEENGDEYLYDRVKSVCTGVKDLIDRQLLKLTPEEHPYAVRVVEKAQSAMNMACRFIWSASRPYLYEMGHALRSFISVYSGAARIRPEAEELLAQLENVMDGLNGK